LDELPGLIFDEKKGCEFYQKKRYESYFQLLEEEPSVMAQDAVELMQQNSHQSRRELLEKLKKKHVGDSENACQEDPEPRSSFLVIYQFSSLLDS
jgi:hypothetical protein